MITYNDPRSADLIPAYTPRDIDLDPFILTSILSIVMVCAILIGIIRRFRIDVEEETKAVVAGGLFLIAVSVAFFAAIKINENTKAYDIEDVEMQLNVDVETDFNRYIVTLADGTRHTNCNVEPASRWNIHDFEEQPYQLMCNGEQITAQR